MRLCIQVLGGTDILHDMDNKIVVILTVKNRKGEKYETANKKIMCNVNCRNNAI